MIIRKFYLFLALCIGQAGLLSAYRPSAKKVEDTPQEKLLKVLQGKKKKGEVLAPTEALFVAYCLKRKEAIKQYAYDKFAVRIAEVEQSMDKDGYVTFAHGRRWEWNFLNDIWNLICAVHDGHDAMSDKISLRQRDNKDCDPKELFAMRKDLVTNGASSFVYSSADEKSKNAELTFMSRTLLSGGAYTGGCYLFEDMNWAESSAYTFVEKLVHKYGLQEYEAEIEKLFQRHKASNKHGELLAISVKKSFLPSMVYKAYDGGFKDKSCEDVLSYIAKTADNVEKQKDYLEDEFNIYCLAVSDIPGEDPTHYKIQSIHLADQKKYQEYKVALQKLFEKIKSDKVTTADSK